MGSIGIGAVQQGRQPAVIQVNRPMMLSLQGAVSPMKETGRPEKVTGLGSLSLRRERQDFKEETRRVRRCSHKEGWRNSQHWGRGNGWARRA